MMGIFALHDERVYLNEMLFKSNHQGCEFPLEHWFIPKHKQLFIPLSAGAVAALDYMQDPDFKVYQELLTPELCGILVCADTRVFEVGIQGEGVALRRVPVSMTNGLQCKGVSYTRAWHRDLEEAFTTALRITGSLEKANALLAQSTLGLPGKPVYTTLPQLVWGAITQDAKLIRTPISRDALSELVRRELPKLRNKAKKSQDTKNEKTD